MTLASKDIQANPNSYSLRNYYGFELSRAGRLEEAQAEYEKSISLYPEWGISYNNLGSILLKEAKDGNDKILIEKARYNFEQAIAYAPMAEPAYVNLAILMDAYDEPTKTKEYILQALKKFPSNYKLWALLAVAENRLGNVVDAKVAAEKAVRFNPSCSDCVKFLQSLNAGH